MGMCQQAIEALKKGLSEGAVTPPFVCVNNEMVMLKDKPLLLWDWCQKQKVSFDTIWRNIRARMNNHGVTFDEAARLECLWCVKG